MTAATITRDPYSEGAEAYRRGRPLTANPYGEGGDRPYDISDWNLGWSSAEEGLKTLSDRQLSAELLGTNPRGGLAHYLGAACREAFRRRLPVDLWCDDCGDLWETQVAGVADLLACPHCRGPNVGSGPDALWPLEEDR